MMAGKREGEMHSQDYDENIFILSCKTMLYTHRRPPKDPNSPEGIIPGHCFFLNFDPEGISFLLSFQIQHESSGGGQSSLGYLFGSGEASPPKPSTPLPQSKAPVPVPAEPVVPKKSASPPVDNAK
ncbi:hypothetical protein IFM89_005844 [Coptis chinensis]|uniref:Uncharacterized protein n=1 Tax=Coptis chinensis TaxID=261450 RepID=A0A835HLM5_9MAGN|nr:hypothetical protein IFM89_005844 [Coptis chinensis]